IKSLWEKSRTEGRAIDFAGLALLHAIDRLRSGTVENKVYFWEINRLECWRAVRDVLGLFFRGLSDFMVMTCFCSLWKTRGVRNCGANRLILCAPRKRRAGMKRLA